MRRILPVILLTLSLTTAFGQEVIRGVIKDDAGGALPGATILVKGTNTATVSDVEGNFSIKATGELPITLVVNSVGFKAQDVEVYELSEEAIEVALKSDNILDEVVVIGYGELKRRDITGSVASIPTELKSQPVASVERLLQGAIPGAIVTQTSGQPGGGVSVQIRGSNSITASSDPLYVIDGFPINGDYGIADAGITNGPKINPMSS